MKIFDYNEKTKQKFLTFAAVFLIFGGYLSYIYSINNDGKMEILGEDGNLNNELHIGDVELVSANETLKENLNIISNNIKNSGIVANDEVENIELNDNKVIDTSSPTLNNIKAGDDSYFYETRLEQENLFSEMIETYQNLIDNVQTPAEQKAIAVQEITNITKMKNSIKIAENLIRNKGFEDVVIMINNESATVIVKKEKLFKEDISKLQNILTRELSIDISNINITNK